MVSFRIGAPVALVAALVVNTGRAGDYIVPAQAQTQQSHASAAGYVSPQRAMVQRVGNVVSAPQGYGPPPQMGRYPQLNAPLYPSPVQYTPPWTGGAIITNQAFAPHEMLYPHDYHALYPPFYYKVRGGWVVTPFGVRQHERWKLQGTDVRIKYRGHIPLLAGFIPPG